MPNLRYWKMRGNKKPSVHFNAKLVYFSIIVFFLAVGCAENVYQAPPPQGYSSSKISESEIRQQLEETYQKMKNQYPNEKFADITEKSKGLDEAAALKDKAKAKELEVFKEKAKAWRALPAKPPLPESANRYRVLAEDAFKEKDFYKAIDYYNKGLEIYPLWPAGQFNAALICGELKLYTEAVGHMQRYLALVPDAKDAKAAREKIYIWEEKAKY